MTVYTSTVGFTIKSLFIYTFFWNLKSMVITSCKPILQLSLTIQFFLLGHYYTTVLKCLYTLIRHKRSQKNKQNFTITWLLVSYKTIKKNCIFSNNHIFKNLSSNVYFLAKTQLLKIEFYYESSIYSVPEGIVKKCLAYELPNRTSGKMKISGWQYTIPKGTVT